MDGFAAIRDENLHGEPANKAYIDKLIGEGTVVRFIQALQKWLKISVGNEVYNLTKFDEKIQIQQ